MIRWIVHRNRIANGKNRPQEGTIKVCGEYKTKGQEKADVVRMPAEISELALKNPFLKTALSVAGRLSARASFAHDEASVLE